MVLNRFALRRKRVTIPKNATFRLTTEGQEKIRDGTMTAQMRVMIAISTIGSSADLEEIAGQSGMSRGRAERELVKLLQKGYVQRVGGTVRDDD